MNPRILFCIFSVLIFTFGYSQNNSFLDSNCIETKKNEAIRSARIFLENKFSSQDISQHFVVDTSSCYIVCDYYKTYFGSTSAYCPPDGFEIVFNVALNGKTFSGLLDSHLFIQVDSSLVVVSDSLEDVWRHGYFEAWENVISNKYKFNYLNVLQFAQKKMLKNFAIDFGFEKKNKRTFKYYWFVTEGFILYRINPKSGKVKTSKLLPVNVSEDGL